jgi:hypothetical protein
MVKPHSFGAEVQLRANPHAMRPDPMPKPDPSQFNRAPRSPVVDAQVVSVGARVGYNGMARSVGHQQSQLSPRTLPIPIACIKLASRGTS